MFKLSYVFINIKYHRRAATEICVISDVLAVTKEKRYMILDPIPTETIEAKPMAQIYLRKKVCHFCSVSTTYIFEITIHIHIQLPTIIQYIYTIF